MTKLQKIDYIKQNNVTYIEQKLSELDLTKSQYDFMTQYEISQEWEIKEKLRIGVKLLIQARQAVFDAISTHLSGKICVVNSKIMNPSQLIKFYLTELVTPLDSRCSMLNLFGVKNHAETVKIDICSNKHLGKFAEPNIQPEDQILDLCYYKMEMDGISEQC